MLHNKKWKQCQPGKCEKSISLIDPSSEGEGEREREREREREKDIFVVKYLLCSVITYLSTLFYFYSIF